MGPGVRVWGGAGPGRLEWGWHRGRLITKQGKACAWAGDRPGRPDAKPALGPDSRLRLGPVQPPSTKSRPPTAAKPG